MADEFDERLKAAAQENFNKIDASAAFLCLFNEKMADDPIPLLQMGLAIYLDKPIALLVPEGATLPNNLRKAAERIEYFKRDVEDTRSFHQAADRLATWLSWKMGQKSK